MATDVMVERRTGSVSTRHISASESLMRFSNRISSSVLTVVVSSTCV